MKITIYLPLGLGKYIKKKLKRYLCFSCCYQNVLEQNEEKTNLIDNDNI